MEELSRTARKTKNAIMESALSLFKEKGFDAVTIEEITQKAGVAKGSFYTYFATKSDIIVDEFWKIDAFYGAWASANLKRYKSADEKLIAFTKAQMKYVQDVIGNQNLKILYANQVLQPGSDKIISSTARQWVLIIKTIIAEGQDKGEYRTDIDAERLAILFNRSARAVLLEWCIQDADFDLIKEGVFFIKEWILRSLRPA
ncbi:hypothetical protein MASR2M78_14350 [Treponema sp.]